VLRLVCARGSRYPLFVFGFQHHELERLHRGVVLPVDLNEVGVAGQALFFAAQSHVEMARILERAGVLPEDVLARIARGKRVKHEWTG
jgi:hypothetical protein